MHTARFRWLSISALSLIAGSILTGCSFDPSGVATDPRPDGGSPGDIDASVVDAPPDAPSCQPGCEGDSLRVCEPAEALTPCALGCNTAADACFETLVPANGAGTALSDDVNAGLVVETDTEGNIDTDTGEVVLDGATVRPNDAADSVANGMGFYLLADQMAVLSLTGLTVETGATLRASGTRSLIILSRGDIVIEGVVDISAGCADGFAMHCGGPGGGSGSVSESDSAVGCAPGGNGTGGFGSDVDETGGGGGGLGTDGGSGGGGGNQEPGGSGGVVAGNQCPAPRLVPLRGGSGGGAGGIDTAGGEGGGGAGGLQLTSLTRIAITGQSTDTPVGIVAAGGGGRGGDFSAGGGGGGAGGAILLEAPDITLTTAVLAANGGAGGGGGDDQDGRRGENGTFGDSQAVGGGSGNGQGGLGASLLGPATDGAGGGDNTGGGGGGAGIIRLNVPETALTITDSIISPAHTRGDPMVQ